jgi:hypothetical protein
MEHLILIRTNGLAILCFLYYLLLNYTKPYRFIINFKLDKIVIKTITFT